MEKNYMRSGNLIEGLKELIKLIKPNSIMVEIGCFAGESTELFAPAVKKLYAVDPWIDNYDPGTSLRYSMKEAKEAFDKRLSKFDNVEVLQMTSEEASKEFSDNSIDIIYIDGDHRYEFVKKDIELWLPKLKKEGIISGHDFSIGNIKRAIKETIGSIDKEFVDTSWLHYLGKEKRLKILDVGGSYKTYPNATHIIDIRPPNEKNCLQEYTQMNICEGTWPFKDKEFDFVFCGNTLEDIKNPLFVCKEIMRVGKKGRIIVPDILTECTKGVDAWTGNEDYAGFFHHRWLIGLGENKLELIPKTPIVNFDWTGHISEEEKKKHYYAVFDWKDTFDIVEWESPNWNMVYDFLSDYFKIDPLGRNIKFEEYKAKCFEEDLKRQKDVGNLHKKELNTPKS